MSSSRIASLSDCHEFRQTLQAAPPAIVHGCVGLLLALLGAALTWTAVTQADLVVRARGRVRPESTPIRIVNASRGEVLSASHGGRVVEVYAREGDRVCSGQVLVRLDTTRLASEIAKCRQQIRTTHEDLTRLSGLDGLLAAQFDAARMKSEAELAEAQKKAAMAKDRQAAEIRLAEVEVAFAQEELRVQEKLAEKQAASAKDVERTRQELRRAQGSLAKAQLPIETDDVAVFHRLLAIVEKDYAVRLAELVSKKAEKQAEENSAHIELASLELECEQAELKAPSDGIVITGDVKVGDVLEPNATVMEIAAMKGFRFEVAVPTDDVAHLRPGMPVRIKLDAFDYQKYGTVEGSVESVSPDSLYVEDQKRHAYIVRIILPRTELVRGARSGQLKLGMAGQAEIVTARETILSLLVKKVRQSISLG